MDGSYNAWPTPAGLDADGKIDVYKFEGWVNRATGELEATPPTTFAAGTSEYYAQWKNEGTVTFRFDTKGGSVIIPAEGDTPANQYAFVNGTTTADVVADTDLTSDAYKPVKAGYRFMGWFDKDGSDSGDWGTQQTQLPEKFEYDKVYYAKWQALDVTYTFDYNFGATPATEVWNGTTDLAFADSDYAEAGSFPQLGDEVRAGYTFAGWFTAADSGDEVTYDGVGGFKWNDGDVTEEGTPAQPVSSNTTFYAHWTANEVTITFNWNYTADGATEPHKVVWTGNAEQPISTGTSSETGTAPVALPTPTRDGYTFGSWRLEGSNTNLTMPSAFGTESVEYFARWNGLPVSIQFVSNWDGHDYATISGVTGGVPKDTDVWPDLTVGDASGRDGYKFMGWFTQDGYSVSNGNPDWNGQWGTQVSGLTPTFEWSNDNATGEGSQRTCTYTYYGKWEPQNAQSLLRGQPAVA